MAAITMPAFATWLPTTSAAQQASYALIADKATIATQYAWISTQAPTTANPPSRFCDTDWIVLRSDPANQWLKAALVSTLG
jgi:hypothetical protein